MRRESGGWEEDGEEDERVGIKRMMWDKGKKWEKRGKDGKSDAKCGLKK